MSNSKPARTPVELDPQLQARLLERMRAEREAALRTRNLKRYLLLPGFLGALAWSGSLMVYGSQTESLVGNIIATSLAWFLWKVRNRLGPLFGFG